MQRETTVLRAMRPLMRTLLLPRDATFLIVLRSYENTNGWTDWIARARCAAP